MEYYRSEVAKSGCFVILALAVGTAMLFWIAGPVEMGEDFVTLRVAFDDVSGIRAKAPVRMAGNPIGKVVDVQNTPDGRAVLLLSIRASIAERLHRDAQFSIKIASLLGSVYVDVTLGSPSAPVAVVEQPFEGTSTGGVNAMIAQGQALFRALTDAVDALDVEGLQTEARALSTELRRFAEQGNALLSRQQKNIDATIENVAAMVVDLRDALSKNREQLDALIANARIVSDVASENAAVLAEKFRTLMTSTQTYIEEHLVKLTDDVSRLSADVDSLVLDNSKAIHETLRSIRATAANLQLLSAKLKADPSLLVWGSGDGSSDAGAVPKRQARAERALRDRDRMPLYDKRED